jgi:hypothetical protein
MNAKLLGVAALLMAFAANGDRASASPIQFGSNYYDFVATNGINGITWEEASAAAALSVFGGVNGHLATITSAAENSFLANSFNFSAFNGTLALGWLGGQVNSSGISSWVVGPEAGQQFSSGQTPLNGMYTNWGGIEPNNAPSAVNMMVGNINWFGITQGKWADDTDATLAAEANFGGIVGYFVEYESPTPTPLPAALPLFATGLGAMGLFGWWRKRKVAAIAA